MQKFEGKRIRDLRDQNDWSKRKLATMLQCSRQSIIAYEKNLVAPNARTLAKLADIGKTSVSYFFVESV